MSIGFVFVKGTTRRKSLLYELVRDVNIQIIYDKTI